MVSGDRQLAEESDADAKVLRDLAERWLQANAWSYGSKSAPARQKILAEAMNFGRRARQLI